jgi:hypothetical protein
VRWDVHVSRSGQRTGKMHRLLTDGQEAGGTDKIHWEGPFYSCVGGGWMGWMGRLGSALAASSRPRPVSSARTRGRRRCSERLLQQPRVGATLAWRCPLAAGCGDMDRASEPR